jgi:fission process protein 1
LITSSLPNVLFSPPACHHLKEHGLDPTRAFAHATTFNALANLALPAVIIHTQVHVAARIFKSIGKFTKYGPTLAGLALIPALPYICDHPVENVITQLFDKVWPEPTAPEKKIH